MPITRRHDRGNEYWVYFRFRGRRVRRRSPIQTRKGAEEFERQLLREFGDDLAVGRDPFAGPPPTLGEFAPRWMREYAATHHGPSTIIGTEQCFRNHLVPALGDRRLDQITSALVDRLQSQLAEKGLAPKTVNNVLSVLHTCLETAQRWNLIHRVPAFEWLSLNEPETRVLSELEEQSLIDACPPGFWQTLVVFFLHTGVRFSEAAALGWADLATDRPAPAVRITKGGARGRPGPTKTKTHRDVSLDPVLLAMLNALPHTSELIFPKPSGGQMDPASKLQYLHGFCRRAGIRPCGWHALRHTFATRLVTRGVPIRTVQRLLGHSTLEMTMRYVHLDPESMRTVSAVIAQAMANPSARVHQVSTSTLPSPSRPFTVVPANEKTPASAEVSRWGG